MSVKTSQGKRLRRRRRVRAKIRGTAERPRLAVFRSNHGIFAQLVDDDAGKTLAASSWLDLPKSFKGGKTEQASEVGKRLADSAKKAGELLAERAKAAGVENCVFDRGGYRYHGKVKALADGARAGGLRF